MVCAGRGTCAPDYRISRRAFPYLAIEYVTSGRGVFNADGRRYDLCPGSVLSYDPSTEHRINSVGNRLTKYFLDLSGTVTESRRKEGNLEGMERGGKGDRLVFRMGVFRINSTSKPETFAVFVFGSF